MQTEERKHPNYLAVWAGLAVLTLIELALVYFKLPRQLLVPALVLLAVWKALLVALYFMHLRFEPKKLLVIVLAPLPLALILVLFVLQEYAKP
ncbi:MAG: cytochrome C oxidase subunit IV family protein [Gemmatimonadetes bacterium]|nr:cytochrome C oxidase subunit IV family protein [Gemmatimonadota bacterium]